jgi:hypothetical protein
LPNYPTPTLIERQGQAQRQLLRSTGFLGQIYGIMRDSIMVYALRTALLF